MRIVQLITRLIVGGAQRTALETAVFMRARGFDSEIWFGPQTGPEGTLEGEAAARGVPLRTVPQLVKEVDPLRDLACMRSLTREMKRARIDLLHTHSSKAGILGRRAGRAAGVPRIVHTIHGWGFSRHTPWPALRAFVAAERMAAPWADALIAVSRAVRDEGLARGIGHPDLYRLIRYGIDTAPFADPDAIERRGAGFRELLGIPAGAIVAGCVGRMSPQKNPMMIVDAAIALPGIHWVWIGDGPLRSEMEEEIRRRNVGGRVHLPGLRTDIASCLGALDLFVLPSLWEGAPLTILEAAAAAIPIVAADVGGVAEVVPPPPAGRCFRSGDVRGFVAAVAAALSELPAAREAARQNRPRSLEENSRARMLEKIYALYAGLPGPETMTPGKPLPPGRSRP